MFLTYNNKLKARARRLRKFGTFSEVLFWSQVKNNKLGYRFLRQRPIGNYIVDFYCPKLNLIIEIDGVSHDSKIEYDIFRQEHLQLLGFHVIRFLDADVKSNLESVIKKVIEYINLHESKITKSSSSPPL